MIFRLSDVLFFASINIVPPWSSSSTGDLGAGMVDTSQTPALGFMVTVIDRRVQTLFPIMQRHLRSGTTVYSDSWVAYRSVQKLPAVSQYNMVNHSLNFVDPVTGVHMQNIESYWNWVKMKFKRIKGVHEAMLMSYLDKLIWRERHGTATSTALASLC